MENLSFFLKSVENPSICRYLCLYRTPSPYVNELLYTHNRDTLLLDQYLLKTLRNRRNYNIINIERICCTRLVSIHAEKDPPKTRRRGKSLSNLDPLSCWLTECTSILEECNPSSSELHPRYRRRLGVSRVPPP